MTCPAVKLLTDVDCSLTIKCDLDQFHGGLHEDRIHNLLWKTPHADRYARTRVDPKIYIHKGRPAPAILEKI